MRSPKLVNGADYAPRNRSPGKWNRCKLGWVAVWLATYIRALNDLIKCRLVSCQWTTVLTIDYTNIRHATAD